MDSTPPEARFAALVDALRDTPGVAAPGAEGGRRFGDGALKAHGRIFAMLAQGRLVLKLPRQRVDALIQAGLGERFDPGHGRIMKEWLSLSPDAPEDWLALAREALAFVAPR
jgi:hypothetical protein